jgi:hypothetical protein
MDIFLEMFVRVAFYTQFPVTDTIKVWLDSNNNMREYTREIDDETNFDVRRASRSRLSTFRTSFGEPNLKSARIT